MTSNVAVVLASSDNTVDVGTLIAHALSRAWLDCPYPKYVVLSTDAARWDDNSWQRLVAGRSDGWREELIAALACLEPSIQQVILILDDFLFLKPVDTELVAAVVRDAQHRGMGYVRLKPVDRSWLGNVLRRLTPLRIERLQPNEPYPSSLQIALWRRDHLLRMLTLPGTIWDFEHQYLPDEPHYAIAGARPIKYRHVVERGRWLGYAPRLFARVGLPFEPGDRPVWDRFYMMRSAVGRIRFGLFGYLPMRIKQVLRRD